MLDVVRMMGISGKSLRDLAESSGEDVSTATVGQAGGVARKGGSGGTSRRSQDSTSAEHKPRSRSVTRDTRLEQLQHELGSGSRRVAVRSAGGKEHVVPEADNSVWPYRTTLPDNGRDNVRSRKVMRVPSPSHSEVLTEQPSVTAPDVATDRPVSRSKPLSNRRGVADEQNTEQEIFISHRWSKPEQRESNKRIRTPRNLTSVSVLGDVSRLAQSEAEELAPESYAEAVKSKEWRESMMAEIKALMNRGCWRVVRTPQGVRLIKSNYV